MNGLCLHTGGRLATLDEIRQVPTPAATKTWNPYPYCELIQHTLGSLQAAGYGVKSQQHGLWKDDARYFGAMELENEKFVSPDQALMLGLRSSYDMTFAVSICVGSRVFVCDNLAFSAEIRINRKNTTYVKRDMPKLINAAVDKLSSKYASDALRVEQYKQWALSDKDAHDLTIRCLDAGAFGVRNIQSVLDGWRKPEHPEFEPRTKWSLFNAVTATYRKVPPDEVLGRSLRLYEVFDCENN